MLKKNFIILTVALLMIATVPSCNLYPDDDTRVEDLDIVLTHYDKENDFSLNHTYSLVDEVVEVDDDTTNPPDAVANSSLILQQIDANMQALGYEKVADSANPDVRLVATASDQTYWFYYYYYDYWYWYGGWYGWGGWWGYPCCYYYPPSYPVVESYTTGTLAIQMAQTRGVTPGDTVRMVWTGIVNGLLNEDTQSNLKVRIKSSIDEAFAQSPYLKVE